MIDFVQAVNGKLRLHSLRASALATPKVCGPQKRRGIGLLTRNPSEGRSRQPEFMNEPTYAVMGGAPKGYNAADYARDIAVFGPWLKKNSPGTIFLGPGSVGEGCDRDGRNAP